MTRSMKTAAVVAFTLCSLGVAGADTPHGEQTRALMTFLSDTQQIRETGSQFAPRARPDEAKCSELLALVAKNGGRPEDRLYAGELEYYKAEGWAKDAKGAYVLVKDAPKICAAYGRMLRIQPVANTLHKTAQSLRTLGMVTPEEVGSTYGTQGVTAAEACMATVDKALKDGVAGDIAVKIDGKDMTLAEGRVQICEAYLAKAKTFAGAVDTAHKARYEKAAAPYRALGVKGERLELFTSNVEVGFYVAGCRTHVTDPKVIAKARALFHWLEMQDGTHLVRKYTFAGDKVRAVETTYARMDQAYKGCR
jgi:hypothetical protein